MNILFLGPQGSGKGTQARLLAQKFELFYFDNGGFLRELAKKNDVVRETINSGKLVPNKEMASYIEAFFDEKQIWDGIIFDGFPRTIEQYDFFKKWLSDKKVTLDFVFVLIIREKTTIERLSARRMDPATGIIYNLITNPPSAEVNMDSLVQREDDKPEAIKKRLQIYKEMTEPLVNKLKEESKVFEIDGERAIDEIQKEIERIIKNEKN